MLVKVKEKVSEFKPQVETESKEPHKFKRFLSVDIKSGDIILDRRSELFSCEILTGKKPLYPWTSFRHNGWGWERVGPGDRQLEPVIERE